MYVQRTYGQTADSWEGDVTYQLSASAAKSFIIILNNKG